ncbi:precorrin-6Y C5,15-methyltransferase (decarboxylating) subunit CbiT [Clostridium senegalense]|uniref:precorrin-6Y C5,15-methyltransferase (decarboxylating) subunit CbiT n=1 Tax=Clostridium senegalense TaxID=1465809 RepID=UPI001C105848|nr:precorrin-6Y C5,15-methyltransferase (decarboxylating) subunit CbiT [Clostridium senegalense]MBU5227696.1 precorrin-6Y C5,15-methyltransferase (decarboxylating) subunit CbiT [Clostridium senegalense]
MKFIKDEEFIRGNCPMTKEEVRVLSVTKLELEENYRVLDIGAGTGSVSIQMSKICNKGQVISVEMNKDAIETTKENIRKFNVENMMLIEKEALEALDYIEGTFDGIFIGGSGGNIDKIIELYGNMLKPNKKIVLNFITVANLYKAVETLKNLNYKVDVSQITVAKAKGKSMMLMANNPIFIVVGEKQ